MTGAGDDDDSSATDGRDAAPVGAPMRPVAVEAELEPENDPDTITDTASATAAATATDDATDADWESADAPMIEAPRIRAISGGAFLGKSPEEFETILGTADEETVELMGAIDIHALPRGTTIASHVVLASLGDDVLGPIYVAYDGEGDRKVALRLLAFPIDEPGTGERQLALVESLSAIARVSHPCIVAIYDVGLWTGGVYVATEFVDGISLATWIEARDEPFPWREVVRVFREAGRGIVAAHAGGVLHRDVSPDKILMGEAGQVRVVDFGLAPTSEDSEDDTFEHVFELRRKLGLDDTLAPQPVVGTLEYAAPEVLAGGTADARADQFSFCVALYEALYGERPFMALHRDALAAELLQGQVRAAPEGAHVPAWLRKVVCKGLALQPGDRWPSMERLLRELDRDPSASRRRWGRGLGVVAVLAAGAGVVAWHIERTQADCSAGDDGLVDEWGQKRRSELQRVFAASKAPYAADNFAATSDAIEAWTGHWRHLRIEACMATRVRAEASDELYAERLACLDARQGELRALLTVLGSVDDAALQRSLHAVESMTPTRVCTRPSALEELTHGAEADLERLADVRTRVDRAWVLLRLDRPAAAEALLGELANDGGDPLQHPGLQASLLRLRGAIAAAQGHTAGAESLLHRAALAASGDDLDHALALAWIDLAALLAGLPGRQAEASHTVDHAAVVLDRARYDEERWRLAAVRAEVAAHSAKAGDALARYHEALGEVDREQRRDWARMELLLRLGELVAARGDLPAATGYFDRAYQTARERLGARHPVLAQPLLRIGDLQSQQHEGVEARASWEQALALLTAAHGAEGQPTITAVLTIAARLRSDADAAGALEYDRRALAAIEHAGSRDDALLAATLVDEGRSLLALARDVEAATPLQRAHALREAAHRKAHAGGSTEQRREAAARLLEATVLLARATASDPALRERAVELGREAQTLAGEHGIEVDPWIAELVRASGGAAP